MHKQLCQFMTALVGDYAYRCNREAVQGSEFCWHHVRRDSLPGAGSSRRERALKALEELKRLLDEILEEAKHGT